jgi:hypothetical protein
VHDGANSKIGSYTLRAGILESGRGRCPAPLSADGFLVLGIWRGLVFGGCCGIAPAGCCGLACVLGGGRSHLRPESHTKRKIFDRIVFYYTKHDVAVHKQDRTEFGVPVILVPRKHGEVRKKPNISIRKV